MKRRDFLKALSAPVVALFGTTTANDMQVEPALDAAYLEMNRPAEIQWPEPVSADDLPTFSRSVISLFLRPAK